MAQLTTTGPDGADLAGASSPRCASDTANLSGAMVAEPILHRGRVVARFRH